MSKTVAVIDGNSLMHRAYHAVPPTMNAPDGTPTNACFGFVAMLLKFVEMAHPDAIVCAFDAGRPKWRMEAIEQYKAQRPPMDDALKVQFPLMEGLLEAMNIPVVRVKGWEGDDILGTVSARDEALGYRTLLVSGDKDVYQLVSELTHVVTTKKGITDVAIYGPDEVFERYGVTPAQFPDFLGLKGDASDNIPGVPGVGDKTAAKLLSAYGNLEGIYEHTGELKGKQKEKIETNRDQAFASRKVATISRDVDFELDLEDAAFPSFDAARVTAAFKNVRFNAHLTHVLNLVGEKAPTERAALSWEPILHGADARAAVKGAIAEGERVGVAFVEPEQASLFDTGAFAAFSTSKGAAAFEGDEALSVLAQVVAQGRFATLDAKEMLHRVYPADTAQEALITDEELFAAEIFDVGLAGYVMNSSVSDYTLASLADEYLGGALPEVKTDEERACVLAAAARALEE
uniref:5'-3' exonuclease H3TH domain-containing protein n=1 Tax=uncultured Ellagibacter sp. TaxID=2137580 RepID=UPI00260B084F